MLGKKQNISSLNGAFFRVMNSSHGIPIRQKSPSKTNPSRRCGLRSTWKFPRGVYPAPRLCHVFPKEIAKGEMKPIIVVIIIPFNKAGYFLRKRDSQGEYFQSSQHIPSHFSSAQHRISSEDIGRLSKRFDVDHVTVPFPFIWIERGETSFPFSRRIERTRFLQNGPLPVIGRGP